MDKIIKTKCDVWKHTYDGEKGVIYLLLWSGRLMTVDMNTGEKSGAYKTVPYCNQMILSQDKSLIIFKSTVGQFAVFNTDNLNEPVWKFRLKKIGNTDHDFVLIDNKLYGDANYYKPDEQAIWYKYYEIDLNTQDIKFEAFSPDDDTPGEIKDKVKAILKNTPKAERPVPPEKFEKMYGASWVCGNDKFDFILDDYITAFPKGSEIPYKYSRAFCEKKEEEARKLKEELRVEHERLVRECKVFDGKVYCICPDEEGGLLYCASDKLYIIDLNTGKIVGAHTLIFEPNFVVLNREKGLIIVHNRNRFAVYGKEDFTKPVWDWQFGYEDTYLPASYSGDEVYWNTFTAEKRKGEKDWEYGIFYGIANVETREVKEEICFADYLNFGRDYPLIWQAEEKVKHEYELGMGCKYENDKFTFKRDDNPYCLLVIPKAEKAAKPEPKKAERPNADVLKKGFIKELSEDSDAADTVMLGYDWALASLEEKAEAAGKTLYEYLADGKITEEETILYAIGWLQAEMENGGIYQYFSNGDETEFGLIIKAFELIGAKQAVKVVKKGIKLITDFNKKENPTEAAYERLEEKFEDLEGEFEEDYFQLAFDYLKNIVK